MHSRFRPDTIRYPPMMQPLTLQVEATRFSKKMGQGKGENSVMAYLNSITLVGFVGSAPEQRQAKGNGSRFTVLSVATQRSWKNPDDEWTSKTEWHRIVVFRPLGFRRPF